MLPVDPQPDLLHDQQQDPLVGPPPDPLEDPALEEVRRMLRQYLQEVGGGQLQQQGLEEQQEPQMQADQLLGQGPQLQADQPLDQEPELPPMPPLVEEPELPPIPPLDLDRELYAFMAQLEELGNAGLPPYQDAARGQQQGPGGQLQQQGLEEQQEQPHWGWEPPAPPQPEAGEQQHQQQQQQQLVPPAAPGPGHPIQADSRVVTIAMGDLDQAEAGTPNRLTANMAEFVGLRVTAKCNEGGEVSARELRAWRAMAGSRHQIHVHLKRGWAADFYGPHQFLDVMGGVVEGAVGHVRAKDPHLWAEALSHGVQAVADRGTGAVYPCPLEP